MNASDAQAVETPSSGRVRSQKSTRWHINETIGEMLDGVRL
jgi:hypothetical protein